LLQHYFRQPYAIGVAILAPWQIALVPVIPAQKATAELQDVSARDWKSPMIHIKIAEAALYVRAHATFNFVGLIWM
jgi:hypothetical protein